MWIDMDQDVTERPPFNFLINLLTLQVGESEIYSHDYHSQGLGKGETNPNIDFAFGVSAKLRVEKTAWYDEYDDEDKAIKKLIFVKN